MCPCLTGSYDVVKIVAQNVWGTKSIPHFHFVRKPSFVGQSFGLEHTVENGYVRVLAKTSGMFTVPPIGPESTKGRGSVRFPCSLRISTPMSGAFKPDESFAGLRRIAADAEVNGRRLSAFDEFNLYPIVPGKSGSFTVDDGRLADQLRFPDRILDDLSWKSKGRCKRGEMPTRFFRCGPSWAERSRSLSSPILRSSIKASTSGAEAAGTSSRQPHRPGEHVPREDHEDSRRSVS